MALRLLNEESAIPTPESKTMSCLSQGFAALSLVCCTLICVLAWTSSCNGDRGTEPSLIHSEREADRNHLVDEYIIPLGIKDPAVLAAMRHVPRHRFVPIADAAFAYEDGPLPIGYDQTISQPSLVAKMTEALKLKKTDKVLEIGTGSGYQAAILGELVDEVFTIEIVEPLARQAELTLKKLGYRNIRFRVSDGYNGWPEEAPFDAIIVTAAPDHVPQPLLDQLAVGGRLILPVGKFFQTLDLYQRTEDGFDHKTLSLVRFVPLVRERERE
ncbi:protein-L-isoaspartate(D-aspartate) O-methyltransferase [Petrachloros mirabilis]